MVRGQVRADTNHEDTMNLSDAQTRSLEAFLGYLQYICLIKCFKIREQHVMVAISPVYLDGNPEHGYDEETNDLVHNLNSALAGFDLKFSDAGFEEDGSGEYFLYS